MQYQVVAESDIPATAILELIGLPIGSRALAGEVIQTFSLSMLPGGGIEQAIKVRLRPILA
jgi:hypothetical protein